MEGLQKLPDVKEKCLEKNSSYCLLGASKGVTPRMGSQGRQSTVLRIGWGTSGDRRTVVAGQHNQLRRHSQWNKPRRCDCVRQRTVGRDLRQEYWQFPVRKEDRHKVFFQMQGLVFQYCVAAMGHVHVKRTMHTILFRVIGMGLFGYLADFVLQAMIFEEFLWLLR